MMLKIGVRVACFELYEFTNYKLHVVIAYRYHEEFSINSHILIV